MNFIHELHKKPKTYYLKPYSQHEFQARITRILQEL